MNNYSLERREAFEKPYLSIDLADLNLLEPIRDILSGLECVHRVNISEGKRKHLTIYIQKFFKIEECEKMIKEALDGFDDSKVFRTEAEHPEDEPQKHETIKIESKYAVAPEEKVGHTQKLLTNQLDTLPTDGCPIVFISYAWDDDSHKDWVRKLSDDLRATYGVYTLLDQYNRGGANLINFMQRGIKVSKRVLIIGSPLYAKKLEEGLVSGAVFEDNIINAEIYNGFGKDKFIPVLRRGSFKTSFGSIIGTNVGYDMSKDEKYDEVIEALAADLWDEPEVVAPELATKPVFKKKSIVTPSPVQLVQTHKDLAQYLKDSFDPYKGEKWVKRLLEAFSFNLMDGYFERMPNRFDKNILTSFDMWQAGIGQTTFKINDASLSTLTIDFFRQWEKVVDLGIPHYVTSNNGTDYYFTGLQMDVFIDPEKEKAFMEIHAELLELQKKYKMWADYIKSNYPGIDLEDTSAVFESNYCK